MSVEIKQLKINAQFGERAVEAPIASHLNNAGSCQGACTMDALAEVANLQRKLARLVREQ